MILRKNIVYAYVMILDELIEHLILKKANDADNVKDDR